MGIRLPPLVVGISGEYNPVTIPAVEVVHHGGSAGLRHILVSARLTTFASFGPECLHPEFGALQGYFDSFVAVAPHKGPERSEKHIRADS